MEISPEKKKFEKKIEVKEKQCDEKLVARRFGCAMKWPQTRRGQWDGNGSPEAKHTTLFVFLFFLDAHAFAFTDFNFDVLISFGCFFFSCFASAANVDEVSSAQKRTKVENKCNIEIKAVWIKSAAVRKMFESSCYFVGGQF